MASQNFFDSASEITVALKYIPQFASRPAATGYAPGSLIFDTTDNAFYEVSNSAWAVVPLLTTVAALNDISDVDVSGALDGQSLTYDASTSTWKAEAFSIASLNDVGDVNVAGVTGNQILYFDSGTSTWKAQAFSTQETYSSASDLTADLNSVYAALTGATFAGDVAANNFKVANAGNIGSVGDPDAMSIAATGDVTLTQDLSVLGSLDVSGTLTTNIFSVTTLSATNISANTASIFTLGAAFGTMSTLTVSGSATVDSLKVINAGTIGSVGDPDAIAISATGDVSLTQDLDVAGNLDVSNITINDGGTIGSVSDIDAITISATGDVAFSQDVTIKDGGTIGSVSDPDAISITATGDVALTQDLTIKDGGTIGSASDPDAITISSAGLVTFSAGTKGVTESFIIACSDETTDLTTGTAKATFRMPYAFTVQEVRASVTTAPVGSTIIVDINEGGTTILSTKLSIDASEKTSTTAATPPVISDSALADDAEITIDIDQVGSGTAGAGLKVALIGVRA